MSGHILSHWIGGWDGTCFAPGYYQAAETRTWHLASVIGMIEAGRSCVDLAQQLHAVESAVAIAKRELVLDHMEHCLGGEVSKAGKIAMGEFKALAKYL